jgi:hypothetical protein
LKTRAEIHPIFENSASGILTGLDHKIVRTSELEGRIKNNLSL